jgi:hypothetical protein
MNYQQSRSIKLTTMNTTFTAVANENFNNVDTYYSPPIDARHFHRSRPQELELKQKNNRIYRYETNADGQPMQEG